MALVGLRVPTLVRSNGTVQPTIQSSEHPARVTEADARVPDRIAQVLTALQQSVSVATRQQRASLAGEAIVFEDVAVGSGGATVTLRHGLGRRVAWRVLDWARTTPGGYHELERAAATDTDNLVLASYVAGTATIEIY